MDVTKKTCEDIRCYYYDCGWCYHPSLDRPNGCTGYANCASFTTEKLGQIDWVDDDKVVVKGEE